MNKNFTFFVVSFLALFLTASGSFVQLQAEEINLKEYQIE
jgi:hypothetical protein